MKEKQEKRYEMDMCSGPILRKMLIFTLPLVCSSILQLLFNAADIVVVGRFAGDHSLAAVGSNGALINLLTNLFIGLSVGANVLTGLCYGAKKEKDLSETVHTAQCVQWYFSGHRRFFQCQVDTDLDAGTAGGSGPGNPVSEDLFSRHAGNDDLQLRKCHSKGSRRYKEATVLSERGRCH